MPGMFAKDTEMHDEIWKFARREGSLHSVPMQMY